MIKVFGKIHKKNYGGVGGGSVQGVGVVAVAYLRFCDWYGHRRGVWGPPWSGAQGAKPPEAPAF